MSNPNLPFNQQPFAGSSWATNQDAGIALNLRRRQGQGLPPPWYRSPTPEQVRRRAVRKMIWHWYRAASYAFLAVLFAIAGVSLMPSRLASALAAYAGAALLALLSLRRARRARRVLREEVTREAS